LREKGRAGDLRRGDPKGPLTAAFAAAVPPRRLTWIPLARIGFGPNASV
jgi:hypothetical protein